MIHFIISLLHGLFNFSETMKQIQLTSYVSRLIVNKNDNNLSLTRNSLISSCFGGFHFSCELRDHLVSIHG